MSPQFTDSALCSSKFLCWKYISRKTEPKQTQNFSTRDQTIWNFLQACTSLKRLGVSPAEHLSGHLFSFDFLKVKDGTGLLLGHSVSAGTTHRAKPWARRPHAHTKDVPVTVKDSIASLARTSDIDTAVSQSSCGEAANGAVACAHTHTRIHGWACKKLAPMQMQRPDCSDRQWVSGQDAGELWVANAVHHTHPEPKEARMMAKGGGQDPRNWRSINSQPPSQLQRLHFVKIQHFLYWIIPNPKSTDFLFIILYLTSIWTCSSWQTHISHYNKAICFYLCTLQ